MLLTGGVVVAISAGVTVSTPTASYGAAVRLAGTTIGIGPSFDAFGLSFPLMFYGTIVPEGDSFHTVPYPAQLTLSIPIISDLPVLSDLPYWPQSLKRSEAIGAGFLLQDIATAPVGEKLLIIGISQGNQVAEIARAEMATMANYVAHAKDYAFIFIGNPYQPNGGILTRLAGLGDVPILGAILGDIFPFGRPGPSDSPFKTTYYQNQYDGVADFPAYFNPLSIVNEIAGMAFGHAFPGYVTEYTDAPNAVTTQVGNTTYVTIPQYLPILQPLRIPASLIGAQRFVDAFDPVLRVFVEMGYDRTADPSHVQEFSWITPQAKVQEALNALPGAFKQSQAILAGEPYVPTMPQPIVSDTEPETPVTPHPADPVDNSPLAQSVRQAVVDMAKAISDATRPLAKVLQAIGAATSPRTPVAPVDTTTAPKASLRQPAQAQTAQTQTESPRTDPVQRRLKALPSPKDSDRSTVRSARKAEATEKVGKTAQSKKSENARKTAKSGKSAPAPRHRPSAHKSAHAG